MSEVVGCCKNSDSVYRGVGFRDTCVGVQVNLFVFDDPPQVLYEDVVAPRPLPSMLILISLLARTLMKSVDVNWLP
jgi:hypothetical protein